MSSVICPIWGTAAEVLPGYATRDGFGVVSARAGGEFFISRTAAAILQSESDSLRVKISFEIARHNALHSVPEIISSTIESLKRQNDASVEDRAKMLLRYFVSETRHIGQSLTDFTIQESIQDRNVFGFFSKMGQKSEKLLAWSSSQNADEVSFLIDMLVERGAVRIDKAEILPDITVLAKGFDQEANSAQSPDAEQAFIAMWFDDSMLEAYELGIDTAVRSAGYRPMRIDRKEHINKIDDEILAEIRKSKFVVADFTSNVGNPRGGVYFEAGFALALGKPVIWTCRHDIIDQVHFDTRQFNHIVWSNPSDLEERLKNRIGAVVGLGPLKGA